MWFKNSDVALDYFDSAPFRFVNTRELAASPNEVFAILADADAWARWSSDVREVRWLTPEPHGVGSERHVVLKSLQAKERFIAWEPGRRFVFTILEITVPVTSAMAEDYVLEPLPSGGTRLTWTACYTLKPLARVIHPILRAIFGKMFRRAADELRDHVASRRG
jgi:uncharacterized protein YndB with AHSA1/START domain